MEFFDIPENKKDVIYQWANANKDKHDNELLNLFMDEMIGKF